MLQGGSDVPESWNAKRMAMDASWLQFAKSACRSAATVDQTAGQGAVECNDLADETLPIFVVDGES